MSTTSGLTEKVLYSRGQLWFEFLECDTSEVSLAICGLNARGYGSAGAKAQRQSAQAQAQRGQLDLEEAAVRNATVRIGFQFRHEKRVDDVRSPFEWINSVDLDRFMDAF